MNWFLYKCRSCGKDDSVSTVFKEPVDALAAISRTLDGQGNPSKGDPALQIFHRCYEGQKVSGTGISDLVGLITSREEEAA